MTSLLRMLLVATALLSSGALQVAEAVADDECCAGEADGQDASCPDCPPGVPCACCPMRGAIQGAGTEVVPDTSPGIPVVAAAAEPRLGASATDIFHPPRA